MNPLEQLRLDFYADIQKILYDSMRGQLVELTLKADEYIDKAYRMEEDGRNPK
jgi:hypothetical protein